VCAIGSSVVTPTPIFFLAHYSPIISSLETWARMRCTHTCSHAIPFVFILFWLWLTLSILPRPVPILPSIDTTLVSYPFLWCDCDLHCNSCLKGGLMDLAWILLALRLIMCLHPRCGHPYFDCHHSPLPLVGNSLSETGHLGC
jgi:hypothetical protein